MYKMDNTARKTEAYAFNCTWRINHGTRAQCKEMVDHVAQMEDCAWWHYAIEECPDGLGVQFHLHMSIVFEKKRILYSFKKNIERFGKALGHKADPNALITARSVKMKRAFDHQWIENYCQSKEVNKVAESDLSGEITDEIMLKFPTQDEQDAFQAIAAATDEQMERLAIEFTKWCMPPEDQDKMVYLANGHYDDYQEGKINLSELCAKFFYHIMIVEKKMKIPNEKRKLVNLRQMFELYISHREGKHGYWKMFLSEKELEKTPNQIKEENKKLIKEVNDLLNN